jgi:hypothetical protein
MRRSPARRIHVGPTSAGTHLGTRLVVCGTAAAVAAAVLAACSRGAGSPHGTPAVAVASASSEPVLAQQRLSTCASELSAYVDIGVNLVKANQLASDYYAAMADSIFYVLGSSLIPKYVQTEGTDGTEVAEQALAAAAVHSCETSGTPLMTRGQWSLTQQNADAPYQPGLTRVTVFSDTVIPPGATAAASTTAAESLSPSSSVPITLATDGAATSRARANAVNACTVWGSRIGIASADAGPIEQRAADIASKAQSDDPRWTQLAKQMRELSDLPHNSLTPSQMALAQKDGPAVKAACATLGVSFAY